MDIVERLNDSLSAGYSELRKEAAVEIVRLRAEVEAAEKEVAHIKEVEFPRKARAVAAGWETKCARLEQERDALRAKVSDSAINVEYLGNLKKSYEELIEELQDERDRLRAKVEAMEQQEPPRGWWDDLIADISAIDCMYRGSPIYAHDAYWMRDRVMWTLKQRRDSTPGVKGE